MKSRISIEVDFANNNLPVIQIISRFSDDVRDKLIKSFLQSLEHTSRWCTIEYKDDVAEGIGELSAHRWQIIPVTPMQLEQEINLMQAELERIRNTTKS